MREADVSAVHATARTFSAAARRRNRSPRDCSGSLPLEAALRNCRDILRQASGGAAVALSKVQSVDQRMRLECGVGFRQLRTCRRTRPGQLRATCCREQMQRYPMKPAGRSEGCGRKAKRRGDTLHTAHDAPLEMPDRSRAEPLHRHAAGTPPRTAAAGRRRRSWPQDATNITHDKGRYHTQESWKGLLSQRK